MNEDRITYLNDVDHWRGRADQARALASQIMEPQTRATMLQIADGYITMAKHAKARAVKGREVRPTRYATPATGPIDKLAP